MNLVNSSGLKVKLMFQRRLKSADEKTVEVHYMYMSTDHKCLEHELVLCYLC